MVLNKKCSINTILREKAEVF